jgi:hypothetical protein
MAGMDRNFQTVRDRTGLGVAATAFVALLMFAGLAYAEDSAPPPGVTPDPPQTEPGPPASAQPSDGVLGTIGKIIDQSISTVGNGVSAVGAGVSAGVKGAGDALGATTEAAGDVAKGVTDTAGTIVRLPTNVVEGMQRCAPAQNGAPDCESASVLLCRSKGFPQGRSVDITTQRKCPASVWLQNRTPTDLECRNESFVTKAACQ